MTHPSVIVNKCVKYPDPTWQWGVMARTQISSICALWPWPWRYGLGSKSWHTLGSWTNNRVKYYPDRTWQWGVMARTQISSICALWPWPWRYDLGLRSCHTLGSWTTIVWNYIQIEQGSKKFWPGHDLNRQGDSYISPQTLFAGGIIIVDWYGDWTGYPFMSWHTWWCTDGKKNIETFRHSIIVCRYLMAWRCRCLQPRVSWPWSKIKVRVTVLQQKPVSNLNFTMLTWIWVILHTIIAHDPMVCHDLELSSKFKLTREVTALPNDTFGSWTIVVWNVQIQRESKEWWPLIQIWGIYVPLGASVFHKQV